MAKPGFIAVFMVMAIGLTGCSTLGLSDEEEQASIAEPAITEVPKVAVQRIENLELGRLFNGFMLTSIAIAPGVGYYEPELRIRYGGQQGPDGFFEYDFVAKPPENKEAGANAPITARYIRADTELTPEMLRTARGVRVWSARDSVEGRF